MTTYIHYGSDIFISEAVLPIRNSGWQTKPEGGLWGSRADDTYDWKEWCEESDFYLERLQHSFRFTFSAARILTLNTPDDLKTLPKLREFLVLNSLPTIPFCIPVRSVFHS